MSEQPIAARFIAAVNDYIELHNAKMERYGLTEFIPTVEYVADEEEDPLLFFSRYTFPDHTPHRHLFFFEEFRENDEYIAFGGNDNYNDVYMVEKLTGRVLVFSEEEELRYAAAESFAAFLEAFTLLIELEVALGRQARIDNPLAILNEVVIAAGGASYRAFYAFIFPIGVEEISNG